MFTTLNRNQNPARHKAQQNTRFDSSQFTFTRDVSFLKQTHCIIPCGGKTRFYINFKMITNQNQSNLFHMYFAIFVESNSGI